MNEIHKMEWIGYGQKPIVALINFLQDKILYSHKIQLIPSKGGGYKTPELHKQMQEWYGTWRDEKYSRGSTWRVEEVNECYMPRHASDNPLRGGNNIW